MLATDNVVFLRPEEMAAKLRISLRKLQQMMRDGTAPKHIRLGTKVVFLEKSDGS